jgi:hypothetical protein
MKDKFKALKIELAKRRLENELKKYEKKQEMKKIYLLESTMSTEAFSSMRRLKLELTNRIEVNKGHTVKYSDIEQYSGYTEQRITYKCMSTDGVYFKQTYVIKVYQIDRHW